jgi:signal transduction histidine kinase
MVTLEISDDGAGFDVSRPGAPNSDSAQGDATSRHAGSETGARGMGLNTMKRRASDLGASLEVQSAPGKGTRIRVEVPLNVKEPSDE